MNRSARRRLPVLALLFSAPLFVSYTADVQADPAADRGAVAEAAVCDPSADSAEALQARLADAAEQARARGAVRDVIVLNGQGYNYAAGQGRDLEQIRRELARQQRESGR
jgi:hypothetical protein